MKNLKRALSLALSSVMLVGMMAVGAGAASFGDADKIEHTDAVNTMVALGVIKGDDKGNFDPERTVTRAEMTKMICVALNGGKDPNLSGGGLYPDTQKHWASGYIDYCTNVGIVSGDNHGNFNPDKTITGTEAAKMILIALGFNAQNEKYVNDANWALNINVDASAKGLYDDVAVLPAAGLSRDNAAQMLYNGMEAKMVEYDYKLNTENGNLVTVAIAKDKNPAVNILGEKFDLLIQEGYMSKVTYNSTKEEYTYSVLNDGVAIDTALSGSPANFVAVTDKADHTDLYGDYVKMLYKPTSSGNELFGIYSISDSTLTVKKGDMTIASDGKSFKVDGVKYTVSGTVNAVPTYFGTVAATDKGTVSTAATSDTLKFIDQDGDGDFEYAVLVESVVGKVTFVGKENVTIGTASYDIADDIEKMYDGIAKNDYAVVTKNDFTGKHTVEAAETITGKITAVKDTNTVQIDGVWYKKGAAAALTAANVGSTYKLAVVGGYYYDATITNEAGVSADVLYISAVDDLADTLGKKTVKAKAWFTDGSSQAITISKIDDVDVTDSTKLASGTDPNLTGTSPDQYGHATTVVAGAMYRFAKDSNNEYTLYHLASTNDVTKAGYETYAANNSGVKFDEDKDKLTNGSDYTIADDAVFFVQVNYTGKNDVKVVSGKTIKTWSADFGAAGQVLANKVNGFSTVRVGSLICSIDTVISGNANRNYGYITAAPYIGKNADGDWAVALTVWTVDGEKNIEVTSVGSSGTAVSSSTALDSTTGLVKGGFVAYELDNDGYAVKIQTVGSKYAVSALAGKNLELKAGSAAAVAAKTDDDTVFIYINSADVAGVAGGELQMANETAISNLYVNNVVAEDGTIGSGVAANGTLSVVFVDIANSMGTNSTKTIADNTTTPVGVQIDEDNHIIYLNGQTVAKTDFATTDTASKLVVTGAGYVVTAAGTNLAAGDTILVVATDGTSVTYTVAAGAMPA